MTTARIISLATIVSAFFQDILIFNPALAGPAFSCNKANTKVEKIICQDSSLADLDSRLGKAYSILMELSGRDSSIVKDEQNWLKERNKCESASCIKRQTEHRLSKVEDLVNEKKRIEATHKAAEEEFRKNKSSLLKEGARELRKQYGESLKDVDLSESSFYCTGLLDQWDCSAYYQGCASTSEGGRCCSDVSFKIVKGDKGLYIGPTSITSLDDACKDQ
jgi:uncharacterized protein